MDNPGQLTPEKKVYSIGWMAFGACFGGPLAGAYFLSKNFEIFGDKEAARRSLIIGALSLVILAVGFVFTPEPFMDKIPSSVFHFIYGSIIYAYANAYQKKNIDAHIAAGGKTYSSWRVGGISLLCLIPALLTLFIVAAIAVQFGVIE